MSGCLPVSGDLCRVPKRLQDSGTAEGRIRAEIEDAGPVTEPPGHPLLFGCNGSPARAPLRSKQVALRSAMRKGTRLAASGVGGCNRSTARGHPLPKYRHSLSAGNAFSHATVV